MMSSDLVGFVGWVTLNKKCLGFAPGSRAACAIRTFGGTPIGRWRGESDILYIGSATNSNGIRQRIFQYLKPGPTQTTNQRVNKHLTRTPMEISWILSNEPGNIEHQLLKRYSNEHNELPPLNHATRRLLKVSLSESVGVTDSVAVN
jgi:hypothetical protein